MEPRATAEHTENGRLPTTTLTRRQREIAGLLAHGLTNGEIARQLVLTSGTVANHVASVLQRLGFDSRTEVAAWAVERGLHGTQDRLLTTLEQVLEIQPLNLKSALDCAATLVAEALDAEKVDVFLYEETTDTLVAVGTSKTALANKERAAGLDRLAVASGGRVVQVYMAGEPYFDNEVQSDDEELVGIKRGLEIRSQVAVPLAVGGVRRGVLTAQTTQPAFFNARDLLFLQAVSRWVGITAQQAELAEWNAAAAREDGRRVAAEELVTVLAHDLRNYLTPIRGRIALLQGRAAREQHPGNLHDVVELSRAVRRIDRLISDLLDVARIDQGLFQIAPLSTDLVALVREAAQSVAVPDTEIEVDAPAELHVLADRARLCQAVENLLANAVRHAPSHTAVQARVALDRVGGRPMAVIAVSDRGPGIEPELLPRLFDRFTRSSSSPGLGIGLFMARHIADAHGGRLDVTSSGAGTTFSLFLPSSVEHPADGMAELC
jgi:signal transduction histidine kinase/DNA-binding CsgD family transcriptional regulator